MSNQINSSLNTDLNSPLMMGTLAVLGITSFWMILNCLVSVRKRTDDPTDQIIDSLFTHPQSQKEVPSLPSATDSPPPFLTTPTDLFVRAFLSSSPSPEISAYEDPSFSLEALRQAPDSEISRALGLDTWETEGNKKEAIKEIIECFKTQKATLNLSYLVLTSLPSRCLQRLPHLRELNLCLNKLTSINLSHLSQLRSLGLSNNQLTSIDLSHLSHLEKLDLSDNRLTLIDLSHLSHLKKLDLSGNQLPSINLSGLLKLTILHLSNNRLPSINLSGLSQLQELNLSDNQLTSIDLSGLSQLELLCLHHNKLTSIDVLALLRLRHLYLASNQLQTRPSTSDDSQLETLSFNDNPFMSSDIRK